MLANLTLLSLISRNPSRSPFMQTAQTTQSQKFQFERVGFRNQFSHFFRSYGTDVVIKGSSFSNYLQQVVRVGEVLYEDKRIRKQVRNTNAVFSSMQIRDCIFVVIRTESVSGGAILCFGNLNVYRCRFENCTSGKTGGAIAVFGGLVLERSQFLHIQAAGTGVIFSESLTRTWFNMTDTTIRNAVSETYDGLIMKRNESTTFWLRNNISNGVGIGHFGCVIFQRGTADFSFSVWSCCHQGDFNSGLALMTPAKFCVFKSLFHNLSRGSDLDFGSVAFYCDRCIDGLISMCNFVDCQTRGQGSIFSRSGVTLPVSNCCFTTTEKIERRPYSFIQFESCSFAQESCPKITTVASTRALVHRKTQSVLLVWCAVSGLFALLLFASLFVKKRPRSGFSKLL